MNLKLYYHLPERFIRSNGRIGKIHWFVGEPYSPTATSACGISTEDGELIPHYVRGLAPTKYAVNCKNCLWAIGFKLKD